jgi:glycolate oxidase iron-sulfur subunit
MKPKPFDIEKGRQAFSVDAPSYEQLIHCMRCGLCLPTCPTYALFKIEKTSPRGRLALMRAVSEERLELTDGFAEAMYLCLGCLACQTACPAGVPYGSLLEQARYQIENAQRTRRSPLVQRARQWLFKHLLYGPDNLEPLMPLLRLYQKIGLHRLNLARFLPGPFGDWERLLPPVQSKSVQRTLGQCLDANPPVRGRVGLLAGCLENTLLARMGIATARVLAYNGFEVVIPPRQACCGALPNHLGEREIARQQARDNIQAFEAAGVEVVISDAAGCSAQLKEYGHLLEDDPQYAERAARFAAHAKDVTEFLAEHLPLREGMRPLSMRVAFDDPCHLVHAQGIQSQPRQLLKQIPGLELVELPESTWCCGSAGTYNLTHLQESQALLERKMGHVAKLNIDVLVTANTGCYLQLAKGVKEAGLKIEVLHISELLARAYGLMSDFLLSTN